MRGYLLRPLRRQPLWSSLRALGNSTTVKLTIFIPIIGYLVLLNENVLHYLQLSEQIFGTNSGSALHPSWRILFLYFGLCLIAFASSLHQLFCPSVIKRFASSTDFISFTYPHLTDTEFRLVDEELRQELRQPLPPILEKNERSEVLTLFFITKNTCRAWARWSAFILYVLGFGVLSIPTLNVFYRVAVVTLATIHESLSGQ